MASAERQETPKGVSEDSTWSSAPKLSSKVRELAHRSFHALKANPQPATHIQRQSIEVVQDLRDLRDQIARLQRKIHDRNLGALVTWIDALRQQVEDRLSHEGKEGH